MKKLTYLFFLAIGIIGCSVESLDSTEGDLVTAEMKGVKSTSVEEAFIVPELICAGKEAEFCLEYEGSQNVQVQLYDVATEDWIPIYQESKISQECFTYTLHEVRDYSLRYKIGAGGPGGAYTEVSVSVEDCCKESFSYVDNGDKSYTFTYVPAEDITGAEVVFTFAQGVDVDGLEGWEDNGQTRQSVMDLEACEVYSWTVTLEANCSGNSPNSNVWTDFKVNDVSKKANEEDKFTQSCK